MLAYALAVFSFMHFYFKRDNKKKLRGDYDHLVEGLVRLVHAAVHVVYGQVLEAQTCVEGNGRQCGRTEVEAAFETQLPQARKRAQRCEELERGDWRISAVWLRDDLH